MTDYLGDACLRRDGRDHVLESEIFFFGHPSVIAHPARPAESRKAQHHPTAAAVGTVIPPALQHPQSSALADCGGCCRRHCPLAIRRLGARWHDMNCLVLWHWRMKRRERNCTERVTGTEARSQLTATGFPQCRLNLQLGLASFPPSSGHLIPPSSSSDSYSSSSTLPLWPFPFTHNNMNPSLLGSRFRYRVVSTLRLYRQRYTAYLRNSISDRPLLL